MKSSVAKISSKAERWEEKEDDDEERKKEREKDFI